MSGMGTSFKTHCVWQANVHQAFLFFFSLCWLENGNGKAISSNLFFLLSSNWTTWIVFERVWMNAKSMIQRRFYCLIYHVMLLYEAMILSLCLQPTYINCNWAAINSVVLGVSLTLQLLFQGCLSDLTEGAICGRKVHHNRPWRVGPSFVNRCVRANEIKRSYN